MFSSNAFEKNLRIRTLNSIFYVLFSSKIYDVDSLSAVNKFFPHRHGFQCCPGFTKLKTKRHNLRYLDAKFYPFTSTNHIDTSETELVAAHSKDMAKVYSPSSKFAALLAKQNLDAIIVGHDDPHASEYPHRAFGSLEFISNFTGSAGVALILDSCAYLWTDSRYFIQAARELSSPWKLMKLGEKDVPSVHEFILDNKELKRVGFDSPSTCYKKYLFFKEFLKDRELVGLTESPVYELWAHRRPPLPLDPIRIHPEKYAGVSAKAKIDSVRKMLAKRFADAVVLTLLDEVAYCLNLRGSDLECSPIFYAYLIIERSLASLFIDTRKINSEVSSYLKDCEVQIRDYNDVSKYLESIDNREDTDRKNSPYKLWVSPSASVSICSSFLSKNSTEKPRELIIENTPVCILKAVKNETELRGMKEASILDSIALCRLFAEFEKRKEDGTLFKETEFSLARLSTKFREEEAEFVGCSFDPISSIGPNCAVVHYRPEEGKDAPIEPCIYLLDSGGQYTCGTTDVTRTIHFGIPTAEEKESYTLVLKGHLALRHAVFPGNTSGQVLDVLARQYLWRSGRNYHHGTGHGIGAFLNVHEGPMGISSLLKPTIGNIDVVYLEPGMILSNEPGYYREGCYGVRIENVVYVKKNEANLSEGGEEFLTFDDLTLVPYCKELLDLSLLSEEEVQWINDYHKRIAEVLIPRMEEKSREKYQESINYIKNAEIPLKK